MRYLFFIVIIFIGCNRIEKPPKDFRKFAKKFKTIALPYGKALDRVYNNQLITERMDSMHVYQHIDSTYRQRVNEPLSYGYAYGVRLPRDTFSYIALIYFKSDKSENAFVLNTYSTKGEVVSSLPISQEQKNGKKRICQIDRNRTIKVNTIEGFKKEVKSTVSYRIDWDGKIVKIN